MKSWTELNRFFEHSSQRYSEIKKHFDTMAEVGANWIMEGQYKIAGMHIDLDPAKDRFTVNYCGRRVVFVMTIPSNSEHLMAGHVSVFLEREYVIKDYIEVFKFTITSAGKTNIKDNEGDEIFVINDTGCAYMIMLGVHAAMQNFVFSRTVAPA